MGAFGKRARGVAELQPKIPKFLRQFPDGLLQLCVHSIACVKKQYVDIGTREKPAAAETSERNEGEVRRAVRFSGHEFLPKALPHGFDQGSAPQQSGASGACADELIPDARTFFCGKIAQFRNKRWVRWHGRWFRSSRWVRWNCSLQSSLRPLRSRCQ